MAASIVDQVLAELRPEGDGTRAVTCEELEKHLGLRHQTVSSALCTLRQNGKAYVAERVQNPETQRRVNAYRLVEDLGAAKVIDPHCGRGEAGVVRREDVVAYLARVSDDDWDEILREAAVRAGEVAGQ